MLDRRQGRLQAIAAGLLGLSVLSSGCQTSLLTATAAEGSEVGRRVYSGGVAGATSNGIVTVGRIVGASEEISSQPGSSGETIATSAEPPLATGTEAAPSAGSWHAIESTGPSQSAETPTGAWHPRPSMSYVETSMGIKNLDANTVRAVQVAQPEPNPADLKIQPRKMPAGDIGAAIGEPTPLNGDPAVGHGPPPVPREHAQVPLPPYIIDPPDVLLIESTQALPDQPVRGQHLVRPDGTVSLGIYGSVFVRGMTLEMAREVIAAQIRIRVPKLDTKNVSVDVLAYNSKYYYVITDGGGYGEQVIRFPITGSETVLDAVSQVGGLGAVASKKHIWVARSTAGHHGQNILPVDWIGITQGGSTETNYQVMPNDRIYVKAKAFVTADTAIARFLSPIERIFGITLLGASTVNQIKNGGLNNGTTGR
jgi:polysaccharide export outer membrane protein